MNYDLRNNENDQSQRMVNALEPDTDMPIHRHCGSSETVVVLRGKVLWIYYDNEGNETDRFLVAPKLSCTESVFPKANGIHLFALKVAQ